MLRMLVLPPLQGQMTPTQLLLLLLLLFILQVIAITTPVLGQSIGDSMKPNKTLKEGQTLISPRRKFELGFFSPGNSENRYLGIWFYNLTVQTVVWVANRATPLNSSTGTGILSLTVDGNLSLSNKQGSVFWWTATSNASNPILSLLDSANLVLSAGRTNHVLWQSFDHLGDTLLSGMKIGVDYRTHNLWQLNSWRSVDDPSPGDYYCKVETRGIPEIFVWRGSTKISRDYGPWNFKSFSISNGVYKLDYVSNASAVYLFPQVLDDSIKLRVVINATGSLFLLYWFPQSISWGVYDDLPTNGCDHYALCGANSICDPSFSPICKCIQEFVPKSSQNWNTKKYSDGCVRMSASNNCSSDNFVVLKSMKMPDSLNATADANKTIDECRDWCLKNCSCTAYAMLGATGCVTWFGDLHDIKVVGTARNDLFIRLPISELGSTGGNASHKKLLLAIIIPLVLGFLLFCAALFLCFKKRNDNQVVQAKATESLNVENGEDESELPLFGLLTIRDATKDFADENILGKGGFGIVYKGELGDGQKIAVKKLSKSSAQGINEFKTEVVLIAKLQHRNLVRLLGYCVEEDERILVYEYMQNGSLDAFIFDRRKSVKFNWHERLHIIQGVARGLLYLHQDSRVKIIHRDLKTSNILLDEEMNPKISDFGMARILKGGHLEERTRRIVGTYGYMAPEYALDGCFSEKSDVFSFGVIVLQILSGKGNRVMTPEEEHNNLLDYAWKLWKEDRSLELLEGEIGTSYPTSEVLRCIQVGLLCVQERSEDRPTMRQVVLMLANESIMVPQPEQPGFFSDSKSTEPSQIPVTNDVTLTVLEGR